MSEVAEKHLREKIKQWQQWGEDAIDLGLMDLEKMPELFDKKLYLLNKEAKDKRMIGSHCHWCNKPFKDGEAKTTSNHLMFFHPARCSEEYDKMENKSEKFENRD